MANKQSVVQGDDGVFKIVSKDAKGVEKIEDTVSEVEAMSDAEALQTYQGFVSKAPNKRRAALTLCVSILRNHFSKMDEYKGQGDKETGQLKDSMKEEFRKGEDLFFDQFMEPEHPLHGSFIKGLPPSNERGEAYNLENGKPDFKERYTYFIKTLRKDPSYGAAKNLFLNYWAFVGQEMFYEHDSQLYILPPEVMRVRVAQVKNIVPKDTSWETQAIELMKKLYMPDDPKKPIVLSIERIEEVKKHIALAFDEMKRQENMSKALHAKMKASDVATAAQDAWSNASSGPTGIGTKVVKEATIDD